MSFDGDLIVFFTCVFMQHGTGTKARVVNFENESFKFDFSAEERKMLAPNLTKQRNNVIG